MLNAEMCRQVFSLKRNSMQEHKNQEYGRT